MLYGCGKPPRRQESGQERQKNSSHGGVPELNYLGAKNLDVLGDLGAGGKLGGKRGIE